MNRLGAILVAIVALVLSTGAAEARERSRQVDTREVRYAPSPNWIAPPPEPTETPTRPGAPFRIIAVDHQVRVQGEWLESYYSFKVQILSAQALSFGRLAIEWNPDDSEAIVHKVVIRRAGVETDVLAQRRFTVLQREGGLEQSQLTGTLTGHLQVPGLQVGDELEYVSSRRSRGGVLGAERFGQWLLAYSDSAGAYRMRMAWPADRGLRWRATPDIAGLARSLNGGGLAGVEVNLRDPAAIIPTQGAPDRFNRFRLVEFTEYPDWPAVSSRFHRLFDAATEVTRGGALEGEIARIAAQSSDPKARAEAALALVQDQVRYVYVGLDGGNYRPMTAEQTWLERFGDCKAKTVLLWAILKRLDIPAEPVLVSSGGGDGIDQGLPSPMHFDHVALRATIGAEQFLLDGTLAGERDLEFLNPPAYRWQLPLRSAGAELERGPMLPAQRPQLLTILNYDASAGPNRPGPVEVRDIIFGGAAFGLHNELVAATPDQVNGYMRSYWQQHGEKYEFDQFEWDYDERRQALTISARGTMKDAWSGGPTAGYMIDLPDSSDFAPNQPDRPADQDQALPWMINFPSFRCMVVNIKLPQQRPQFYWDFVSPDLDRRVAGTRFLRRSEMRDGVMRVVMSRRALVPEIDAAQAAEIEPALAAFRENDAYLVETIGSRRGRTANSGAPLPLIAEVDWAGLETPCTPPE